MARTRIYNHSRFDGGMTHNKRDTSDLTKFALLSHLDIYRDHNEMHVMPGFVSDNGFGGSATGLKVYDIRNFAEIGSSTSIFALGTKSDGTGSKIFERNLSESQWKVSTLTGTTGEGSANLIAYPFFWFSGSDFHYPVVSSTTAVIARHGPTAADYQASWQSWLSVIPTGRTEYITGFNSVAYVTKGGIATGVSSISASAMTANAKTTGINPRSIASGNYQIGIVGSIDTPTRSQALLWDAASLLADQNIQIGNGLAEVVGNPGGIWATVSRNGNRSPENNGVDNMTIRVLTGESQDTLLNVPSTATINAITDIYSLNGYYENAMLWYGKITRDSETVEGVWALGKKDINSQYGVTLLLNTSSLGLVENAKVFGSLFYFAHGADGSVSRLGNFRTGTYNIPATIETLIYGADSPYLKQLKGLSIVTENLPSGGSVVCSYRTDEDSAWVTMGASDTVGKQKHNFTKANGTPIGRFQEIQFKIVITGRVTVKNILVAIEETEDLSF